jgi:hypothetical protein
MCMIHLLINVSFEVFQAMQYPQFRTLTAVSRGVTRALRLVEQIIRAMSYH